LIQEIPHMADVLTRRRRAVWSDSDLLEPVPFLITGADDEEEEWEEDDDWDEDDDADDDEDWDEDEEDWDEDWEEDGEDWEEDEEEEEAF
jgi:hypothetical protein